MMDFDNVLSIASQNRSGSNVQKRYSLQTGPPKKDPKSKGVNPAAIQALLKKQQVDHKMKVIERKKQKEELLAKRVELKSDRKARAMASRTKDNFHGYNGIPIVEVPKKRRSKQEMEEESSNSDTFRNGVIDPEDDEDNYEYEQTDSEEEQEPQRNTFNNSSYRSSVKPSAAPKASPLNFAELLKLAEKKQHEPVELKPKIVKKEERLRTADEIRELELERKAKKLDLKGERSSNDGMYHSSSGSSKSTLEKHNKLQKPSTPIISSSSDKQRHEKNNKANFSSKISVNDRDKVNSSHKEKDGVKPGSSSSTSSKMSSRPTHSQVSAKQTGTKLSSSHKSTVSHECPAKKDNSLLLKGKSVGATDGRPSGSALTSQKTLPQKRELQRPGMNATVKSNITPKPGLSSSSKPDHAQARPGGPPQIKSGVRPGPSGVKTQSVGQSRPGNGGPTPGRATGSVGGGPGAPKCTVVSETISSKNVMGSKGGVPPRPGMEQQRPTQQRPGMAQQRPGMAQQRPGMAQQRPGMAQQRPGMAQQRPGMAQQRPGMAQQRPGMAQQRPGMAQQRPGMAQQRPGMAQQRPAQQRPDMAQQRPGMAQQRPAQQRPDMAQQRPDMAQQRPGMAQQRPGMAQQRPGVAQQRPGIAQQRPGVAQQRPGVAQQRPGVAQQRPGMAPSPMNRPPGPMLPPITSAYKRKYEDEEDEYDSEMDDFIDDGDDEQEEISRHIKQIFGYDRNKYKDESDYALRFMESSWKDMQKEEARSLRMAVQEDLEEEKKEEEEMKRKNAKKQRRK